MTEKMISVKVPTVVHARLTSMSDKAGISLSSFASFLLLAAYSARVKPPTGDQNLDNQVARVMVCWGMGMDTASIAHAVGLSEPTVVDVVQAWRDELREQAA